MSTTKITEAAIYGLLNDAMGKSESRAAVSHISRALQEIGVKTIGRTSSATWTKEIPKENLEKFTKEIATSIEFLQSVMSLINITVENNEPLIQNADVLKKGKSKI